MPQRSASPASSPAGALHHREDCDIRSRLRRAVRRGGRVGRKRHPRAASRPATASGRRRRAPACSTATSASLRERRSTFSPRSISTVLLPRRDDTARAGWRYRPSALEYKVMLRGLTATVLADPIMVAWVAEVADRLLARGELTGDQGRRRRTRPPPDAARRPARSARPLCDSRSRSTRNRATIETGPLPMRWELHSPPRCVISVPSLRRSGGGLDHVRPLTCSDLVGKAGFEPAASASRTLRANQAALLPGRPESVAVPAAGSPSVPW